MRTSKQRCALVSYVIAGEHFKFEPTVSAGVFSREAGPERPAMSELGVRLTGRFTLRL